MTPAQAGVFFARRNVAALVDRRMTRERSSFPERRRRNPRYRFPRLSWIIARLAAGPTCTVTSPVLVTPPGSATV